MRPVPPPVRAMRSAAAVRERCERLWRAGEAGRLAHLDIDLGAWPAVVSAVAEEVVRTHPDGDVPVHGRLNHLRGDGWDLAADLLGHTGHASHTGHAGVDAVVVSVLVDAGAGPDWVFDDPVAGRLGRSEGLAVAAHRMVEAGLLSGDRTPWVVDAAGLAQLTPAAFAAAFRVDADNPLVGVEGRVALLNGLGDVLRARDAGSVGELLATDLGDGPLTGPDLLAWVLDAFADLWPRRIVLEGHDLGDTWRHPLAGGEGPTTGLVPFHKLSQWLTYSLVEPLAAEGVAVTGLNELTGLAEYRNGGVLVDLGLVAPRRAPDGPLPPGHALVVEWRALTVAALDRITAELDRHLPEGRRGLSLPQVLEAGTWSLGRRLARERRPDGGPPIAVASDGTVF